MQCIIETAVSPMFRLPRGHRHLISSVFDADHQPFVRVCLVNSSGKHLPSTSLNCGVPKLVSSMFATQRFLVPRFNKLG